MITDEASVRAMKPMRIFSPLPLGVSCEVVASAGLAGLVSLLPPPPQAARNAAAAAPEPVTAASLRKVRRSKGPLHARLRYMKARGVVFPACFENSTRR